MRILITGPECSGKSSLVAFLSTKLKTPVLWEHARTYLQNLSRKYTIEDLLLIAKEHSALFDAIPRSQPLIIDTYLLNIKIWSEYKYGKVDPWILEKLREDIAVDKIILCKPDLPWQQDGMRESKMERDILFDLYKSNLKVLNLEFEILEGLFQAREYKCLELLAKS